MYTKQTPLGLLIIEFINIGATLAFLTLFAKRFYQLRQYSETFKYKNYFPKLRIFFFLAYVILSVALLIYNVKSDSYTLQNWYQYLLQGGGGQCIDSLILLFQLGVFRFQLNKQQPYSRYHLIFFVYLFVIQLGRFAFTLIDVLAQQNDTANLVISALIVSDAFIQLIYWNLRRQSLPQFVNPTDVEIDDLSYHTRHIQNRNIISQKMSMRNTRNFPYIMPFVCYQNGKVKIVLERISLTSFDKRTTKSREHSNFSQQSLDSPNQSLLESSLKKKQSQEQDILTICHYSIQKITKLYAICLRYPLQTQIKLNTSILSELIQSLQVFLDEVFKNQNCYNADILQFFEVSSQVIQQYENLLVINSLQKGNLDRILGIQFPQDQNSTYFSIIGFKSVWIVDHFIFYFKVAARGADLISYPFKKFHDFQNLHHKLKKILKTSGHQFQLPHLPKKMQVKDSNEDAYQTLLNLQIFLRILCNDNNALKFDPIRQAIFVFLGFDPSVAIEPKFQYYFFTQLKIQARSFIFQIRGNQSITKYELNLIKGKDYIKTISKQYLQFQKLLTQFKRWQKNSHFEPKQIELVSKKQKKQVILAKMRQLLQFMVNYENIWKFYGIYSFLDINSSNKLICKFKQKLKPCDSSVSDSRCLSPPLQGQHQSYRKSGIQSNFLSGRISEIIDDLGNQSYD